MEGTTVPIGRANSSDTEAIEQMIWKEKRKQHSDSNTTLQPSLSVHFAKKMRVWSNDIDASATSGESERGERKPWRLGLWYWFYSRRKTERERLRRGRWCWVLCYTTTESFWRWRWNFRFTVQQSRSSSWLMQNSDVVEEASFECASAFFSALRSCQCASKMGRFEFSLQKSFESSAPFHFFPFHSVINMQNIHEKEQLEKKKLSMSSAFDM